MDIEESTVIDVTKAPWRHIPWCGDIAYRTRPMIEKP
jgi:hypothetical protein